MDGAGQAEKLQEMGSAAFAPLRVTPVGPRPFRFEFNGAQASDVGLARIATTPCMVRRTPGSDHLRRPRTRQDHAADTRSERHRAGPPAVPADAG